MLACSATERSLTWFNVAPLVDDFGRLLLALAWLAAMGTLVVAVIVLVAVVLYRLWRGGRVSDFAAKRVFITGSDKGLGRQIALELHRLGLVIYAGCHSERGAQTMRDVGSDRIRPIVVEVTNRESVEAAKKFIEQDLPPGEGLWALVNNAGIVRGVMFDFAQQEDYREVLDVNFYGTINVTEIMLPLVKRARGRIVNMISIMGRCTIAAGPYSCSKFALEAYSDGLRRSMKSFGVHVAIIEPGFFHTNMTERVFWENEIERLWQKLPVDLQLDYGEEFKNSAKTVMGSFIENPPLANFNSLAFVSNDVLHALSAKHPKSRYVNGIDAQLMYKPVSFLPDFVLDFFMCSIIPYHKVSGPKVSALNGTKK